MSIVFHADPRDASFALGLHSLRGTPVKLALTLGWEDDADV